jgi:hypothetical protein
MTTCPLVQMERLAADDLADLLAERETGGTMITSHPFVIATIAGTYLSRDAAGYYVFRDRQQAVRFTRIDATTVEADLRQQGVEAEAMSLVEALDRDIEKNEELLRIIRSV